MTQSNSTTYAYLGAVCLSLPAVYYFYAKYSALALKCKSEERKRRKAEQTVADLGKVEYRYVPIGILESTYTARNFTPNQPQRAPSSRARLKLDSNTSLFKAGSFDTLEQFSHVWVIFVFHENTNLSVKARILPPRKNDTQKVGAFACRSPMRPNPIGLSLVKLEKVDNVGGFLYFSSVDLIDGTPVLDVKPYIPTHDVPLEEARVAPWVGLTSKLVPDFVNIAIDECVTEKLAHMQLGPLYETSEQLLNTLVETIKWDGRKNYTKKRPSDKDYKMQKGQWIINLANVDFICMFETHEGQGVVRVIDTKPFTYSKKHGT
mmetsp:Transcript_30929/g.67566  ORF Transcript_30929/g.67566 Transcript_30929/m.67566 type:complete len:319 (-) Transcript_30929:115-1071(-)|eukprot:CAMPEP_0118929016 /NCGR_PEP_ID=MMETSP1169-20130426/6139_1 /TAXON_ID=36882 /ORGANISM="Pyramimonas obovata, Strain CCMP722" /LENGTH=318 /DNA_ID=CAMNT_0006871129 /DNA_START=68 /DNA_END=1024 /DNA_ORIENTATION=-